MAELLERDDPLAALAACARDAAAGPRRHGAGERRGRHRQDQPARALRPPGVARRPRALGRLRVAGDAAPARAAARHRRAGRARRCARARARRTTAPRCSAPCSTSSRARRRRRVLVFEDVHWADEATLDLVKFLGRRIHRLPALLVLSHRDDVAALGNLRARARRAAAGAPDADRAGAPLARRGRRPGGALGARRRRRRPCRDRRQSVLRHRGAARRRRRRAACRRRCATPCSAAPPSSARGRSRCCSWPRSCRARSSWRSSPRCSRRRPRTSRLPARRPAAGRGRDAALSPRARAHGGRGIDPGAARDAPARAACWRRCRRARAARRRWPSSRITRSAPATSTPSLRWAPQAAREAGARGARREAAAHCRAALAHADGSTTALAPRCSTTTRRTASSSTTSPPRSRRASRRSRCSSGRATRARQCEALAAHAFALVRALRNADADAASRRAIALAESIAAGPAARQGLCDRVVPAHAQPRLRRRRVAWGEKAIALAERCDDRADAWPAPTTRSARR